MLQEIEGAAAGSTAGPFDPSMIDKALESADFNSLRMALYQATGDEALTHMKVVHHPAWGGVMMVEQVAAEHFDEIRQKTKAYLLNPPEAVPPPPKHEEVMRLLEVFAGKNLSPALLEFGAEQLSLDDFPREVKWHDKPPADVLQGLHVSIIGAGVSAIAAAVQLTRLGISYTIFERQPALGGTWQVNKYPEARVDVTSFDYQYHFEKNYPWPNHFSDGGENLKYLNYIAEKWDVAPNIRLNTEVTKATWDEEAGKWEVQIDSPDGSTEIVRSQFLISACGLFNKPKHPDIPGIETFTGDMFHTTAWDPDYDYSGKRIALIGNGSTGSQTLAPLARKGQSVTVFMRTAHWVFPMENYFAEVPAEAHWLMKAMPYYWNWYCYSRFIMTLHLQDVGTYDREWMAKGGIISERNDRLRQVLTAFVHKKMAARPDLAEKLVPSWSPLSRRPIVDSGWYDSLLRDNVELVTSPIDHFTPTGIVTKDGVEREIDMVALAAGFEVSNFLWPVKYVGRNGVTLETAWAKDGARS